MALKFYRKGELDFRKLIAAQQELDFMKKLEHPYIVPCKGYYEDSNYICISMELMEESLDDYVRKDRKRLDEDQVKQIFFKIT